MGFDLGAFAGGVGQGITQGQDIKAKYRKQIQEQRLQKANDMAALVAQQRAAKALQGDTGGGGGGGGGTPSAAPPGGGTPSAPMKAPMQPQAAPPPPQAQQPQQPPRPMPMPGATPMPQGMGGPPQPPPGMPPQTPPGMPPAPQAPPQARPPTPAPGMMAPPPGQGGGGTPGANTPPPPSPNAPGTAGQGQPPPQGGGQGGNGLGISSDMMQQLGQDMQAYSKIGQQHFTATLQEVMADAKQAGKKISPLEAYDTATQLIQNEDLDPNTKTLLMGEISLNRAQLQFALGQGRLGEKTANDETVHEDRVAGQQGKLTIEQMREKARSALQGVIGSQRMKQIEAQGAISERNTDARDATQTGNTNTRVQASIDKDDFDEAVKQYMQDNNLDEQDARAQMTNLVKEYGAQVGAGQTPKGGPPSTAVPHPVRQPLRRPGAGGQGGGGGAQHAAPPFPASTEGQTATSPNGDKWVVKGGKWVIK